MGWGWGGACGGRHPRRSWRRGCKRRRRRLYARKKRLTRECHRAIVTHWEKTYEHVLFPKMPFGHFVRKDMGGGARSPWSRQARRDAHDAAPMALFHHARHRARVNPHFHVHVVSEKNTTQTCSACGYRFNNVTWSAREFVCNQCNFRTDRDVNAAKNILVSEMMRSRPGRS